MSNHVDTCIFTVNGFNLFKKVSKNDYIIARTKSQLGWLNFPHLPYTTLPPPVNAKQR